MKLEIGTEVYNHGDMANEPKFGTVTGVSQDAYGTHLDVTYEDGTRTRLQPCQFSEEFKGHSGTRFVTRAAYQAWRDGRMALLMGRA